MQPLTNTQDQAPITAGQQQLLQNSGKRQRKGQPKKLQPMPEIGALLPGHQAGAVKVENGAAEEGG